MPRLHTQPVSEATGKAAQLFSSIKAAIGGVPNAFADIAANSPNVLESVLSTDAALAKGSLAKQDIEVIKLAVSEVSGCDYCLAAHTMMGKGAGLSQNEIRGARFGHASGNAKLDALGSFARLLITTKGTAPESAIAAVREAGYTDAQIVDTLLAISSITFTNLFNRVNDTTLDFPAAD